jgi:hypothetical protein
LVQRSANVAPKEKGEAEGKGTPTEIEAAAPQASPDQAVKETKTDAAVVKVVNAYITACVPAKMPSVRTDSDGMPSASIAKVIRKAIKENGADYDWQAYFTQASRGAHLRGDNDRKWTATLAWLCNPTNAAKVEAGNYGNTSPASNQHNPLANVTTYKGFGGLDD